MTWSAQAAQRRGWGRCTAGRRAPIWRRQYYAGAIRTSLPSAPSHLGTARLRSRPAPDSPAGHRGHQAGPECLSPMRDVLRNQSAPARVVTVSSNAHSLGSIDPAAALRGRRAGPSWPDTPPEAGSPRPGLPLCPASFEVSGLSAWWRPNGNPRRPSRPTEPLPGPRKLQTS